MGSESPGSTVSMLPQRHPQAAAGGGQRWEGSWAVHKASAGWVKQAIRGQTLQSATQERKARLNISCSLPSLKYLLCLLLRLWDASPSQQDCGWYEFCGRGMAMAGQPASSGPSHLWGNTDC